MKLNVIISEFPSMIRKMKKLIKDFPKRDMYIRSTLYGLKDFPNRSMYTIYASFNPKITQNTHHQ